MKKIMSVVTAFALIGCVFVSCSAKKETKKAEGVEAVEQTGANYETALKECFNALFSANGGKVFFSYMYPNNVIEKMKEDGSYDVAVNNYNEQQANRPDLTDGVYEFGKIISSEPLIEKQETAVKDYMLSLCTEYFPDMKADEFVINEGYQVDYSYFENGTEKGPDTVLVINIGDEGWKIITG